MKKWEYFKTRYTDLPDELLMLNCEGALGWELVSRWTHKVEGGYDSASYVIYNYIFKREKVEEVEVGHTNHEFEYLYGEKTCKVCGERRCSDCDKALEEDETIECASCFEKSRLRAEMI